LADRARQQRQQERRVQCRQQLRAVALERDDGRLQAYGWSLPAKFLMSFASSSSSSSSSGSSSALTSTHVAVPVPVYCRPVSDFATVKVDVALFLFNAVYGLCTVTGVATPMHQIAC